MSNSNWPPQLKQWVQDNLARATPTNKAAVNSELKDVLFQAHRDGTLNTRDWSKIELNTLKAQTSRTTFVPTPAYSLSPPTASTSTAHLQNYQTPLTSAASSFQSRLAPISMPSPSTSYANGNARSNTDTFGAGAGASTVSAALSFDDHASEDGHGQPKKKKKKKNSEAKPAFPSAYEFSSGQDAEALARRAARFAQPAASPSSSTLAVGLVAQPRGVGEWFTDTDGAYGGDTSALGVGAGGGMMVPGQVGKRRMQGKGGLRAGYGYGEEIEDPNVIDWDKFTIRGTSTKLEKPYLRLTSEPSPADIRPLPVLKQTLQLLKSKWKHNHNYKYALDQFKSVRQDLTVQRIKNEFTVEVYEIHARIALEAKDLGEYNQCQTMLRHLYELGISGHPQEFLSYRIIYLLHTRNRSDMASLLAQLTPSEKSDPSIAHALAVHASLATHNYVRFFRLFLSAPNMSGYIMDHFVERERMAALGVMAKAYMSLSLPYLTRTLAFDTEADTDAFLDTHSCAIYTNHPPPDPTPAQAHGAGGHGKGWKSIRKAPETKLEDRVWDCKKAQGAVRAGGEKYRVVDLKGQVD